MVDTIFEIIGYVGMGFILVGFMIKDIFWIRTVSLIGEILSLTFGIYIREYPVILLNAGLIIVQIVYIAQACIAAKKKKQKALEENPSEESQE